MKSGKKFVLSLKRLRIGTGVKKISDARRKSGKSNIFSAGCAKWPVHGSRQGVCISVWRCPAGVIMLG